jgi:hypothetical protein
MLNADVEYYLAKQSSALGETVYSSRLDDITTKLSPKRRAFVDAAVGRGDYQAVLDTTEACGER